MSKWFSITMVVLIVFWLSLLSLTQLRLTAVTRTQSVIIMQHEVDLTGIKMHMQPPRIQARPTPQVAPSAPPLPRQRRRLVAGASEFDSRDVELTERRCGQDSNEENRGVALLGTSARCSKPGAELQ